MRMSKAKARDCLKRQIRLTEATTMANKQNRFPTLSAALEAESIAHMWDMHSLAYGETYGMTYQDGTKHGHYISVHRFSDGHYERPIHYGRG